MVPSVIIEVQMPCVLATLINALETESREYRSPQCREMLTELVVQVERAGISHHPDLRGSIQAAKKTLDGSK